MTGSLRQHLARLVVLFLLLLVAAAPAASARSVTVKSGDTLWKLFGASWLTVARVNHLQNPDLIFPGQQLRVTGSSHAKSTSSPSPAFSGGDTVWDRIAACESSGNWAINTGNGYYGGLQFTLSSWRAAGGSGMPHHASRAEQIRVAENLLKMQGWGAWPACSASLGLR